MKRHHSEGLLVQEIRPIIFGIEDSLVSTLGVIVGIAASGEDRRGILIAGIILVIIEALSMGSGEYLSSKSDEEVRTGREDRLPIVNGFIMWLSYILAGIIPLAPFALLPPQQAIFLAAALSGLTIFLVGVGKARISKRRIHPLRSGFEMLGIAAFAALVGYLLGLVAQQLG